MATPVRVLGLGNELLGDDAFGILVAHEIQRLAPDLVDVVCTPESGFSLLDYILGAPRLLVVDAIQTGRAEPGTLHEIAEGDLESAPGGSPHFVGLFETLELARKLGLPAPSDVRILAVEAADCLTVGGPMHPAVTDAIPEAVRRIQSL
ncbi:MAG: hydrogenase maturation protease, partial [Acidobacteriota bacterium]